ncbi:hypothetical protein [Aeromonas jandaei]|uniref:hypothetical protein n=1 Tax=Aeromonas jandaei TaxID=650 RepID=UPI0011165FF4|nr:hypothetical protein [Aeromonas jandaei]TNH99672.1 hypothetical protein CF104_15075 [Aeromonas jandaei]
METNFKCFKSDTVDSFIQSNEFKDIRSTKQEGVLKLPSGEYKISWDPQQHPHVSPINPNDFSEKDATRLQHGLEITGKAIFLPLPTFNLLGLVSSENIMRANNNKDMLPLICNEPETLKASLDNLITSYETPFDFENFDDGSKPPEITPEQAKTIAQLKNIQILNKDALKALRADDKLYIAGHGEAGDPLLRGTPLDPFNSFDDVNNEEDVDYTTAESIAKSLKGYVPENFSRFYTLTCHSAEARHPISLEPEALNNAATSNLNNDGKIAYAQRFANALQNEGFTNTSVTGYFGSIGVDDSTKMHKTELKLQSNHDVENIENDVTTIEIVGKRLKHTMMPQNS